MLNTLTSATFKYRGHVVTAQRWTDSLSGKFFCWQGCIDNNEEWSVANRSLNKFEKQFQALADKIGERPAYETY